jgi:outer membrane lipoprotein SlyB
METSNRPRLHPLIAAAAISVITVSAAGVGALTGWLPRTSASSTVSSATTAPAPTVRAATAANESAAAATQTSVTPPAGAPAAAPVTTPASATPALKRRKPAVVRTRAPIEERPIEDPVVVRDYGPSTAPAPLPRVAAAANLGTIEAVQEIAQPGEGTGLGAIAGGVLGGVLGSQFGHGNGRKVLTVAGAAGGAYAGHQVEKQARATKRWEITVRMDNGALRTLSTDSAPVWRAGDRVRVINDRLEAV